MTVTWRQVTLCPFVWASNFRLSSKVEFFLTLLFELQIIRTSSVYFILVQKLLLHWSIWYKNQTNTEKATRTSYTWICARHHSLWHKSNCRSFSSSRKYIWAMSSRKSFASTTSIAINVSAIVQKSDIEKTKALVRSKSGHIIKFAWHRVGFEWTQVKNASKNRTTSRRVRSSEWHSFTCKSNSKLKMKKGNV